MTCTKEDYKKYAEAKSPRSPWVKNLLWAFAVGGLICVVGQGLYTLFEKLWRLDRDTVNALVLKGSTLTYEEIERLREICKPRTLTEVVEMFCRFMLKENHENNSDRNR